MKANVPKASAPRKRRWLLWLGAFILVYAVLGFLVLPPIVRSVAVKQLSGQLDREVSIDRVSINPFTFSAAVHGLLIKDPDGQPFISWDDVYVNFQLSSFFGHAWVFQEIRATKPYVRAQMNQDYTFNFSDLISKFSTNASAASPAAKAAPSEPFAIHVKHLRIVGAKAALADFTPREPFKRLVGPLDITLDDFRTDPGNRNPYAFIGTTDAGETISWSGFFSLAPLRSEGELKLFHFDLNKYAALYQDLVRFQVRDGSIALDLNYRLEISPTNRVTVVNGLDVALTDFKLGVPGDTNNLIEVPLAAATGISADLQARTATVDSAVLIGAKAWLDRNTNAAINVVEAAKPAAPASDAPGGVLFLLRSVTNAVALLLESTNQWSGSVRSLSATNCEVHLVDRANARPARLDLSEINLAASNLSNLPGTNLNADFSLRWNANGAIHIVATAAFQPATADIRIDLDHLDLTTLDTYLASRVNLLILGSEVNLHGTARLRPAVNDLPVVSFNGDASLDHFHTVDGVYGRDLLRWDAVRFDHIVANLNPPLVALRDIVVDNAYARVILETNHTINLENVFRPPTAETATNRAPAKTDNGAAHAADSTNSPIQISIGAIIITNTAIRFSDRSVEPPVNLSLQSVNGSIEGISTENLRHAVVNVNALVDGAGPATITGTINPLNGAQTNDLKITVKDVDLTPTSPYAGRFAGYGIAEGKLNLDLTYHLTGRKLAAKNVITLDQFTFGDKVDSAEATHLPVRLAIAILKDRDGKIVLDVPLDGSLDDPKFRIGKVVTRAIVNILEKVATSPFSLIGAAFGGGGEELGYQEFAPGSAILSPADQHKLDALAKALFDRPALKLDITGSVDPDSDRQGLQRAALDQEIRTRKWQKLRRSQQAAISAAQIVLTPADRDHYIAKLYSAALSDGKITPALMAANTNLAAYAHAAFSRSSPVKRGGAMLMSRSVPANAPNVSQPPSKLDPPPSLSEALLLATFPVTAEELEGLAARRAQAVQSYLIATGKVEASRLFVSNAGAQSLRRDGARASLQFR
jgi:hypothetical protein